MALCHQIRAGVVTSTEIPDDGLPLLLLNVTAGKSVHLVALPGEEDEDFSEYTLECLAEIAAKLTPWATVYCCPDASDGDRIRQNIWGYAYWASNTAWIRSTEHPDTAIQNMFHEVYHLAEHWLSGDEISTLRKASERGPAMPRQSEYNAYWCSSIEVRARAFVAWAYSHWLMGTTSSSHRGTPAHERIWASIYTGAIGLRAARRGGIHSSRMPEELRARLAERSDSQKLFDGGWMIASAISVAGLRVPSGHKWHR